MESLKFTAHAVRGGDYWVNSAPPLRAALVASLEEILGELKVLPIQTRDIDVFLPEGHKLPN